jgi:hypothetical protein
MSYLSGYGCVTLREIAHIDDDSILRPSVLPLGQ